MRSPRLTASQQKKYIGVQPDVWSTQLPCALLTHKMQSAQGIRMHEKMSKGDEQKTITDKEGRPDDTTQPHLFPNAFYFLLRQSFRPNVRKFRRQNSDESFK